MKTIPSSPLKLMAAPLVLACALTGCSKNEPTPVAVAGSEAIALFDGETLTGWSHVSVDETLKMEDVWSVKDGTIVCKGEPLGYLVTDDSFQDFKLTLEWRWAAEPTNSGVLLRIASEPIGFMPTCVEAQLMHESAGDIWAFRGAAVDGAAERIKTVEDHEDLGDFKGVEKTKMAEKPAGEWNHYEIVVQGDTIKVTVNGEAINEASGLDIVSGPIGLQSEGSEIHFRNIDLEKL